MRNFCLFIKKTALLFALIFANHVCFSQDNMPIKNSREEVIAVIKKVNGYWQSQNPEHGRAFWDNAAYHTGNMYAYQVTGIEEYKKYSENWAIRNQWKGATSNDKSKWKYASYGESQEHVMFGDWQICFQTYIDLYNLDENKDERKIARAIEVMGYQMSTPNNDYWWWADGLYMVMPVMTKLYKVTGNRLYLEKLYEYFSYANTIMYDHEENLYFRDAKYVYPKHKTINQKKDFWARGVGWTFAALSKVLTDLPENDPHRQEYIDKYKKMAQSIAQCQQPEGYWTRSMLDSKHAPGYETSGTAFFTYGFFWGINNGYLDESEYLPVAAQGWRYLYTIALQSSGLIGYVQPIGERADQHKNVGPNTTSNFGVGAFLLAASELVCYIDNPAKQNLAQSFTPGEIWTDNNGVHINAHGGGIIFNEGKYYWFGEHRPDRGFTTKKGVTCYSSTDLYNWKFESLAMPVEKDENSDITEGCIIERPKVVYNKKTNKFVMFFHSELKGRGYDAARVGIATADNITGPYRFVKTYRPNEGRWPVGMDPRHKKKTHDMKMKWWTPEWTTAVKEGMFTQRDLKTGQMSRDMTVFVDEDGKAYHIYSSEENLTLQIAELSDDYLSHTGKYTRVEPAGHNEAPAIFKRDGKYFMITSGCTGWKPNAARLLVTDNIMGTWKLYPNPCVGTNAELTFNAQGTYILKVEGKDDAFIFMADRWNPKSLSKSSYVWLPIRFRNGLPVLNWEKEWDLSVFDRAETLTSQ